MIKQRFFSACEVATYFGLSESGVRHFANHYSDFPKGIKLGSARRWDFEEIKKWGERHATERRQD